MESAEKRRKSRDLIGRVAASVVPTCLKVLLVISIANMCYFCGIFGGVTDCVSVSLW